MLVDLADYLFARSSGHIGWFMTLIVRGCCQAICSGQEHLSVELLESAIARRASTAGRCGLTIRPRASPSRTPARRDEMGVPTAQATQSRQSMSCSRHAS
jgi:hypothetical protein